MTSVQPDQQQPPDGPGSPPAPDPGNSPPQAWSAPLDEAGRARAFAAINEVAVTLPEPAPPAPAGGAG